MVWGSPTPNVFDALLSLKTVIPVYLDLDFPVGVSPYIGDASPSSSRVDAYASTSMACEVAASLTSLPS